MAAVKKSTDKAIGQKWRMSWKGLFIAASVAANIGLVVMVTTMITSNTLDGMFMNEGLKRYCLSENNDKFTGTTNKVKALRDYTCASGEAKVYFDDGFQKYLDSKGITD